jgi:hypothetical protein
MSWGSSRTKEDRTGGRWRWRSEKTIEGWTWLFYRRNLNIQQPKLNYSYVIHPTFESSMWISKWLHFDEIFAFAVSDRPSEQRFKKSNFCQLRSLFFNIYIFCVTSPPKKNLSSNSAASTTEPKKDRWNMYRKELTSLKNIGILVAHYWLQLPCSFSLRLITL